MAMMALVMPGPSAATKASASTRLGSDRKMSVTRISTASTQPPKIAGDRADHQADRRDDDRRPA